MMRDIGSVTPIALDDRLSTARHMREVILDHMVTHKPTANT